MRRFWVASIDALISMVAVRHINCYDTVHWTVENFGSFIFHTALTFLIDLKGQNMWQLDNSKLGSTQQQKICWHWHVARIISSQKIYGLYAQKHHIVEMRVDVTDAGRTTNERRTTEDRATQPMEAGGWVSQYFHQIIRVILFKLQFLKNDRCLRSCYFQVHIWLISSHLRFHIKKIIDNSNGISTCPLS